MLGTIYVSIENEAIHLSGTLLMFIAGGARARRWRFADEDGCNPMAVWEIHRGVRAKVSLTAC
jgi:hypothetical protein